MHNAVLHTLGGMRTDETYPRPHKSCRLIECPDKHISNNNTREVKGHTEPKSGELVWGQVILSEIRKYGFLKEVTPGSSLRG